ncbi:MAG: hypothetical protein ACI3XZ_05285, partial [Butyricicoccus sp.]
IRQRGLAVQLLNRLIRHAIAQNYYIFHGNTPLEFLLSGYYYCAKTRVCPVFARFLMRLATG